MASRSTTYKAFPEDLIVINDQDHFLYQERANREIPDEEVATALEHGIADVILCARIPGYDNPVVVAGRQRRNALAKANESLTAADRYMIEYKLVKGEPHELVGLMIQENALRTDMTPLEKARDAQKLLDMGQTREEVATRFGVTVQSIKDWGMALSFQPKVLRAIEDRKISLSSALTSFRKTPADKQEDRLKEILQKVPAKRGGTGGAPKKKNMHKAYARFMAGDNEGSTLGAKYLLLLQWVHGEATTAEAEREIPGFKASLSRAKRQLNKESE